MTGGGPSGRGGTSSPLPVAARCSDIGLADNCCLAFESEGVAGGSWRMDAAPSADILHIIHPQWRPHVSFAPLCVLTMDFVLMRTKPALFGLAL